MKNKFITLSTSWRQCGSACHSKQTRSTLFPCFLKALWYNCLSIPFQSRRIVFRALCSVQSFLKVRVMASSQSLCINQSIAAVRFLFLICLFI